MVFGPSYDRIETEFQKNEVLLPDCCPGLEDVFSAAAARHKCENESVSDTSSQ
jgi:hypothetical protein